jgi:TonB family protein
VSPCSLLKGGGVPLFVLFARGQGPDAAAPCVLHLESPDYPEIMRAARVSGTVLVRVKTDDAGSVSSVEQVSGPDGLAIEATRNIRRWVFAPGRPTEIEIRYEFRLDPPGTRQKIGPRVVFDLPSRVLVVSREGEHNW